MMIMIITLLTRHISKENANWEHLIYDINIIVITP